LLETLKAINVDYMEVKRKHLIKLKGRYMSLVLAQIIRRRSKRFCATPDDYSRLYEIRFRKVHTVLANVIMPLME
jgi:hypothetical protein